ncbi:DUF3772 domain-containing protein [Novosphingobium olei]|uniref:DUF3772 domain-containing protein n=1 Tax=Novosphingobium olei TaxID=2728851 RepID=UPI0030882F74|nr:DUF3772 domain-containing protein [Novosphingobium olei]
MPTAAIATRIRVITAVLAAVFAALIPLSAQASAAKAVGETTSPPPVPAISARPAPPTYLDLWSRHAVQARQVLLATPSLPEDIKPLEAMRKVLAADREQAFRAAQTPSVALRILEAQLAALGPTPGKDQTEPAWAADKRAELEAQIKIARAPMLEAQDAQVTADVLIGEIDQRITRKTSTDLFAREPTPLSPVSWSRTPAELASAYARLRQQLKPSDGTTESPSTLGLLLTAMLATVGLYVAIAVQRAFRVRLGGALVRAQSRGGAILLTFLLDVGTLIIPSAIVLIVVLVVMTRVPKVDAGYAIISLVATAGVLLTFALWVGRSLFSPSTAEQRFIAVSDAAARRAVLLVTLLGLALVGEIAVEAASQNYPFSPAVKAVLAFPVLVGSSILLWLLAEILSPLARGDGAGELRAIDVRLHIAWLIRLIGIGGLVAGAAGYVELAREFLMPTLLTLAVIGLGLLTFWRLTMISNAVIERTGTESRHGIRLLPALYAVVIAAVSIPVIAMVWGIRAATIGDFFTTLRNGVAIGAFRISAGDVLVFFAVFAIGYGVTKWIQRIIQLSLFRALELERGVESALLTVIGYAGLLLSLLAAIVSAGLDLSSLAIVAGALSVGAGLGLQGVVANFVSGIILLVERPVRVGDWIEVGGFAGTVEKISVRSTRLRTLAMDDVIIPNSEIITGAVRNRTLADRTGRTDLEVGVAYGTDLGRAFAAITDATRAVPAVVLEPPPLVVLDRFDDSALVLKLLCVVEDVAAAPLVRSQLRMEIYRLFVERGITIPFPQREVILRNASEAPFSA